MQELTNHALKIAANLRIAERDTDLALAAVSETIASMVRARAECGGLTGALGATGQTELVRIGEIHARLLRSTSDLARTHAGMLAIGREKMGPDINEECEDGKRFFTGAQLRVVGE